MHFPTNLDPGTSALSVVRQAQDNKHAGISARKILNLVLVSAGSNRMGANPF
jgi:hypothetical protein